jgi:hypothetical protein
MAVVTQEPEPGRADGSPQTNWQSVTVWPSLTRSSVTVIVATAADCSP